MTRPGIVFVTPWLASGGIERTLEVKLPWFVARGHAVHLASWANAAAPAAEESGVLAVARQSTVPVHNVSVRPATVHRAVGLARLTRQCGVRVAVGHELLANIVVVLAKLLRAGSIRAVVQFHNEPTYAVDGTKPRVLALARRLLPLADEMVAVSEHLRTAHAAFLRVPPHRIRMVYNPFRLAEIERLAAEPAPSVEALRPFIVACGRLAGIKGFADLIAAFASVGASYGARLVILGDGPDRAALIALATAHGVGADVVLPGFVANPFAYFSRASCFVLSSRSEGLANVVVEAMACGAPVVASDCGGIAEVIEPNKTGLVYRPGDVPALTGLLKEVLSSPAQAADLARRAQPRVSTFASDRVLPQLEALYFGHSALQSRHRGLSRAQWNR